MILLTISEVIPKELDFLEMLFLEFILGINLKYIFYGNNK